jgi:molybdate transport system regulatory protein
MTIPPPKKPLVTADLHLMGGLNERLFKLLAAIERTGSINQAAKEVGLTYKGAWEMIERANNLSPKMLVSTVTGGYHGGGTQLTPTGKAFLQLFIDIRQEHQQFLQQVNQRFAADQDVLFLLQRLIMKASARNQFFGKVTAISTGTINVEVIISLRGGDTIVATITKASADTLGIKNGFDVVALIKAPQVILVTDFERCRLSARNHLTGVISRIQKGELTAEVVIELKGGNSVAATITSDSIEILALTIGGSVTAVFKSGAVILGVAA